MISIILSSGEIWHQRDHRSHALAGGEESTRSLLKNRRPECSLSWDPSSGLGSRSSVLWCNQFAHDDEGRYKENATIAAMAVLAAAGPPILHCSSPRDTHAVPRNSASIPSLSHILQPKTPPSLITHALRVPADLLDHLRRLAFPHHGLCGPILPGP